MNSVTCRYHPKAPLIEDYRAGDQVHCQTLPKAQGLGSFQVLSVSTQLKFNFARFGLVGLVWFGSFELTNFGCLGKFSLVGLAWRVSDKGKQ